MELIWHSMFHWVVKKTLWLAQQFVAFYCNFCLDVYDKTLINQLIRNNTYVLLALDLRLSCSQLYNNDENCWKIEKLFETVWLVVPIAYWICTLTWGVSFFLQNDASEIKSDGNMFFSKLCGAQIYCIKKSKDEMCGEDDDYETVFKPRMEKLAQKIK